MFADRKWWMFSAKVEVMELEGQDLAARVLARPLQRSQVRLQIDKSTGNVTCNKAT